MKRKRSRTEGKFLLSSLQTLSLQCWKSGSRSRFRRIQIGILTPKTVRKTVRGEDRRK
jgi:hypothetical protein